ncbi:MAG TPA: M20/M25/M40 family metallo-hydrolase [Blastocatellia bacterium]|jgi:Iap family predicted aminopeptidase|nr:M20/M25/M40 family metallo-hydrolase [Blastocatellia bacterium]
MKSKLSLLLCFVLICLLPARAQDAEGASKLRISTPEEIRSEFDSVPCKNGDRQKTVKALFEKMGAKTEEIAVEKVRGVENVIIRKAAAKDSPEKIVIGAHYDKVPDGCGAIDNWTGVVALAHIYRAVKDLPLKKNVVFVAFGKEEEGLVGSSAMAGEIKKEQAAEYCAMINIDSLGIGIPQTLDNVSSKKLIDFTIALAKEMNVPFAHARIDGASSDSASFIGKKIPAVTIHALNSDWRKILHSNNDQPAKVNHESVYVGYRVALALLVRIDAADCQAFREDKEKK